MDIVVALSILTFALNLGASLTMGAMARAPGWERLRIVAVIAATAGAYSFVNAVSMSMERTREAVELVGEINLAIAAVHVSAWLWFTFADAAGRWTTLPTWVRRLAVANIVTAFGIAASGRMMSDGPMHVIEVPSIGVRFAVTEASPLLNVAMGLIFVVLAVCFWQYVKGFRAGKPGMGAQVLGFTIFFACAMEEMLVTAGALDFIFLAELGFLALVLPVARQMVDRLIGDAQRLQVLSAVLSEQVEVATEERDAAREALATQERFAALGRMAGGVAHEINNPLQVLALSLEDLRESPEAARSPRMLEAVDQSLAAAERIRRIVAGMRTYSPPREMMPERVAPEALVREAVEAAQPVLGEVPDVRMDLGAAPDVLVDRERMLHAIGHALANAARAAVQVPDRQGYVAVRTRATSDGHVLIEVRDNGRGFPEAILSRLGEPFATARKSGDGAGLGIFIIRGVVDTHGGMLELENARGGGAVLRILLPPAVRR